MARLSKTTRVEAFSDGVFAMTASIALNLALAVYFALPSEAAAGISHARRAKHEV